MPELAPPPDPLVRRCQRLESIRDREQQISRLQALQRLEIAALTQEDRGGMVGKYVADELAMVWHRSPRQARSRQDDALVFADFPAVVGLVADGDWLMDHADAVIDELIKSGLARPEQQQVLDLVLDRRRTCTPWELRQSVRSAVLVLFPEHALDLAGKAKTDRDVRMYADAPGAASLHVFGPAHEVTAMWASIDALCGPPQPGDDRTLAQRRFDTMRDLLCGRIQPGNWQVQVLVDLLTLHGDADLPGEIVGLGPVPASLAREVAAAGTLRRVVVDTHGRLVAVDATVHRPDQPPAPEPFRPRWDWTVPDPHEHERYEPDADALSVEDLHWYDTSQDKTLALAAIDVAVRTRRSEPVTSQPAAVRVRRDRSAEQPPYRGVWSPDAFATALQQIRTAPLRPVDLSSNSYVAPKALKRHLELRDKTCVFPGCPRLAAKCDKDHRIPWPRGRTEEANLLDECDHHHHGKHEHFTVTVLADGTVRWTMPCGLTADHPPRPVLEHWRFRDG
jgi:hypothetical protein